MIRIFEHANFVSPEKLPFYKGDPINRNRSLIASRLPSKKFHFLAFSNDNKFYNNISLLPKNKLWPIRLFRFKPDIIHTKLIRSCLKSLKVARLANKKVKHLTSVHGMPETWRLDPKYFKAFDKLVDDADVIHAVSQTTAREIKEKWNRDSVVIYNGVDTNLFFPRKGNKQSNDFRVLFVGRLVSHKHPEVVVELAKLFPEITFTMIGYGEMYDEIMSQIRDMSNIKLIRVPYGEMPNIYRNHDVFLFPSGHEGLSNAVLEAIASGLPVLAKTASSMHEVISDGYNGFLCEDLNTFKEQLARCSEDSKKFHQIASNARESAFKFDWNNILKKYQELFEKLVS